MASSLLAGKVSGSTESLFFLKPVCILGDIAWYTVFLYSVFFILSAIRPSFSVSPMASSSSADTYCVKFFFVISSYWSMACSFLRDSSDTSLSWSIAFVSWSPPRYALIFARSDMFVDLKSDCLCATGSISLDSIRSFMSSPSRRLSIVGMGSIISVTLLCTAPLSTAYLKEALPSIIRTDRLS